MAPPPCRSLGRQCRALDVTLRVAAIEGDEDHDATWFFGHTQRLEFKTSFEEDGELWSEATIHVPCKHLKASPDGTTSTCAAHGFVGKVPALRRKEQPRRLGNDSFLLVEKGNLVKRHLDHPSTHAKATDRALPVIATGNPCATAPCHTSDGTRKAACCRDMQLDIKCSSRQTLLEALLRNRKSPYLCKVSEDESQEGLLNAEIISACGYLQEDGIHCDLHGRHRADGRPAKPLMCSAWPEKRVGLHPGCAFKSRKLPLK